MTRASSFTREQLLASARGELFPNSTARLPSDPMLMFDRIVEINDNGGSHGKGFVRAELDIHPDLWFFQCHFLGDPVRLVYDPKSPAANAEGYVTMPNVNVVEEMTNMISASRAYQTNADVMGTAKTLMEKTLAIGQ